MCSSDHVRLVPWRHDLPYDLLIDAGDRFIRVQCKSGERAATGSTRLRVRPSRNGQVRGINDAEACAFERWVAELAEARLAA